MLLTELILPSVSLGIAWQMVSSPTVALLRSIGLFSTPLPPPQDVDMSGRIVIVTGANTDMAPALWPETYLQVSVDAGLVFSFRARNLAQQYATPGLRIGNRTAFHIARMGAKVIMACRSVERGEAALARIEEELRAEPGAKRDRGTLEVMKCDLGSLRSVRQFARNFKEKHGERLDVLVNNAGVSMRKTLSADGIDECFGTNFIGHFVLTIELMPLIQASPAARLLYLDVEKGSRPSVCASTMPLDSLSGSDYYQPYWLPFGWTIPFEILGPFVGCAPGWPTLPKDEPSASAEMWAACERIVRAAETTHAG